MRLDPTRILQDLRATFWFIPSCMVMLAIVLSFLMPWLDERYSIDPTGSFGWIGQTQTDGARAVLIAVAGSIVGVAGTTFSITMVAVSFASANFGPRLIANFMRDRGNPLTLGTFIATFVYCLLVLKQSVTEQFPDAEMVDSEAPSEDVLAWSERIDVSNCVSGWSREAGFLQRLNLERMTELADDHSLLVRVQYRPGDFIVQGDRLFEIWPQAVSTASEGHADQVDESLITELHECFEMDGQRTPHQDYLFLADQLVEVIARALSPGINDPFTAITCPAGSRAR